MTKKYLTPSMKLTKMTDDIIVTSDLNNQQGNANPSNPGGILVPERRSIWD